MCGFQSLTDLTTTAEHAETNEQVERYLKTAVTCLPHCVAEHQGSWDVLVQELTYAYNAPRHQSTSVFPFRFVLSKHPPGTTTMDFPSALLSYLTGSVSHRLFRNLLLARPAFRTEKIHS